MHVIVGPSYLLCCGVPHRRGVESGSSYIGAQYPLHPVFPAGLANPWQRFDEPEGGVAGETANLRMFCAALCGW